MEEQKGGGSFFKGLLVGLIILAVFIAGGVMDRKYDFKFLDLLVSSSNSQNSVNINQKVLNEESIVIDVAEKVSPSVVTVTIQTPKRRVLQFSPFGGFTQGVEGGDEQDIGSGFVVSKDGFIVTNKHVVSNTQASYKVVTKDGKEYEVKEIQKDPSNDIAILKIDANDLTPIELGSSSNLKVGQFVVAIGTALGEFRHTVTTGVISGLGRGITAGSVYEGYVERLDDVIQTDAAINPGNSGGPLLDSTGRAIGINVAVAQGAQNVGFAIPIDVVSKSLESFKSDGGFPKKPFLGVSYQMISKQTAILNDVPQGAYVSDVVPESPADDVGIQVDDIITEIDGKKLSEDGDLSDILANKKPGDKVKVKIYREGNEQEFEVTLAEVTE